MPRHGLPRHGPPNHGGSSHGLPRHRGVLLGAALLCLLSMGCAPKDEPGSGAPPSGSTSSDGDACARPATVKPGVLTIATDSPAYDPWFSNDDPTNGKGFESAV